MEIAMTIQITTECGTQTVKVDQHFTDEQLEFPIGNNIGGRVIFHLPEPLSTCNF